jgi:general secretion pathway protein A
MDAAETRAYVEHRLATVGWKGDPSFEDGAYDAIFAYTGGIPRKTNTLCDRLLLMGYLEELHNFTEANVNEVVADIAEEFKLPDSGPGSAEDIDISENLGALQSMDQRALDNAQADRRASAELMDERMMRLEKSIVSVLSILKKIVATPGGIAAPGSPAANQTTDRPE